MSMLDDGPVLHPRHAWMASCIDVRDCDRLEIVCALEAHEKAGHTPETWPEAIRNGVRRAITGWLQEHRDRRPVAYAFARVDAADGGRTVVAILFHAPCGCTVPAEAST